MLAFVVDPVRDPKIEVVAQLLEQLGYGVRSVVTREGLAAAPELAVPGDHLIIVPDSASKLLPLAEVLTLAGATKKSAFLIYLAEAIDPDQYKALVRTGGADWVSWKSSLSEIRDICRARRAVRVVDASAEKGPPHVVVTFLGAGGGVGTTSLALECGIHLATQKGKQARRVAVVDLEAQDSVICDYVDLSPRVNFVELMKDPGRLDDYLLQVFTTTHPSGLHIFACDNQRLDVAALDPAVMFALLNRVVEKYDIVLVDAGSQPNPWTEGVLAHSDKVYVVCRYTVPSAKKTLSRLARLKEIGLGERHVAAVVNFCGKDILGRTHRRKEIDPLFSGLETHFVSADIELATECVDTGEPIVQFAPRSGLARDLRKLADSVVTTVPRSL